MSIAKWYFNLWKSRGQNVRRKLLRDLLLVFTLLAIVFGVTLFWQFNSIRIRILKESTGLIMRQAETTYERLSIDQEKSISLLRGVLSDTTLTSENLAHIALTAVSSSQLIVGAEVQTSSGDRFSFGVLSKEPLSDSLSVRIPPDEISWSQVLPSTDIKIPVIAIQTRTIYGCRISYFMNVNELYRQLQSLEFTEHNEIFLFDGKEGKVFNPMLRKTSTLNDVRSELFVPFQLAGSQAISMAMDIMRKTGSNKQVVFSGLGETYCFSSVPIDSQRGDLFLGVILPENDVLTIIRKEFSFFAVSFVAFFLIMSLLLTLVLRRYGNQIKDLPQLHLFRKNGETELLKLIGKGESKHLEFKSSIRYNLQSKSHDKNLEFAWMKGVAGFLNSDGGILLLGVNDHGEVVGTKMDAFANEDKMCLHIKNLISRYLGVSALKYVQIYGINYRMETIAVIEAEPSKSPVYMNHNNEELFFIRSGPSSTKLAVSDVVRYIEEKF